MSFYSKCSGCFINVMAHPFGLFTPLECHLINFTNDIQIHAVRALQKETYGVLEPLLPFPAFSLTLSRLFVSSRPGTFFFFFFFPFHFLKQSSLGKLWISFLDFRMSVISRVCKAYEISIFYTDLQVPTYLCVSSIRLSVRKTKP